MSFMVKLAHLTQPDFRKIARESGRVQLITLTLSHYVELSRWALTLKGIKYDERGFAPGMHVLPILSIRIDKNGKKYTSNSSKTGDKPNSSFPESVQKPKKGGLTAVPLAVLPDSRLLLDSWEIADYSGLAPINPEFKKFLDEEVGILSRQYAYSFLLQPRNHRALTSVFTYGRGFLFKIFWWIFLGRYMPNLMRKIFHSLDSEKVSKCRSQLVNVFETTDKMLREKKTKYLSGSDTEPGVADIALASLLAPVVWASGYADGTMEEALKIIFEDDPKFVEDVAIWRNTETGKYVMNMYSEHRIKPKV